jgi:eukaryotic-like serine/threonine-protein kinase
MDELPVGATLNRGAYQISERLRGTRDRGMYRARSALDLGQGSFLVTLGTRQSRPHAELADALALPAPKVAALRFVGPLEGDLPGSHDALVEDEPAGQPLSVRQPPGRGQLAAIGIELCGVLEALHAGGQLLGGVHPEQVYVQPGGGDALVLSGVAPRAERFLDTAVPPDHGVPSMFDDLYASPEAMNLEPLTPASDVFSLACLLAHLAAGQHPFEGDDLGRQALAIARGRRRAFRGGAALKPVLEAALVAEPGRRPTVVALAAGLRKALAG